MSYVLTWILLFQSLSHYILQYTQFDNRQIDIVTEPQHFVLHEWMNRRWMQQTKMSSFQIISKDQMPFFFSPSKWVNVKMNEKKRITAERNKLNENVIISECDKWRRCHHIIGIQANAFRWKNLNVMKVNGSKRKQLKWRKK